MRPPRPSTSAPGAIAAGRSITIVAIGSSSTAGAGATSSANTYPSRLDGRIEGELLPAISITVINSGIGGETMAEMLARFDEDVFAENPDLVLWQVGSNSVLRDQPLAELSARLREGLKRLRAADTDVVLINPQYAPKVIAKPDAI